MNNQTMITDEQYNSLAAGLREATRCLADLRTMIRAMGRPKPPVYEGSDEARFHSMVQDYAAGKPKVSIREVAHDLIAANELPITHWHLVEIGRALRLAGYERYREGKVEALARGSEKREIRFRRMGVL